MPNVPNTSTPGLTLFSKGDGQNSSYWGAGNSGAIQISKTFAILGPVANYTFPGFFMPVPTGQTVNLVAVIGILSAGTITVKCTQNGGGIGGLTAVSLSSSSTGYVTPSSTPYAVADQDYFTIVTSATSSTGNMTFDFIFSIES